MFNKFFPLEFPAHLVEQGREQMAQSDPQIVDETLTVFAYVMKAMGYVHSLHPAGCVLTATCQNCGSSYSQRFEKRFHYYWACPYCQTITEGMFLAAMWNQREENRLTSSNGQEFWHSEGRTVYDRKYRQSYVVDNQGNLTQDDIPDYVLGRIDTAQLEDAERSRLARIECSE
ncbi:TPA: hypothetical protein JD192_21545 [Cronobacter sakazakii]|nr:hypothetical protein [Cronobacter sakazakii]